LIRAKAYYPRSTNNANLDDTEIKCRIVEKLLRKRVVGDHKWSIDKTVSYALPSHARGRGKQMIRDEMLPANEASLEAYGGGHRENVRLGDVEVAVEFLRENNGNVPFGFG